MRSAIALLTLLAGAYLLQFAGALGVLSGPRNDVVDYKIRNHSPYATISGNVAPFSLIELGYDERGPDGRSGEHTVADSRSNEDGNFEISCSEALLADGTAWLRVSGQNKRKLSRSDFPVAPPTGISIAFFFSERRLLWVAGVAPPARAVKLEWTGAPSDCTAPSSVVADYLGIFDVMVPCSSAPTEVLLQQESSHGPLLMEPSLDVTRPVSRQRVREVTDAALPLARTVAVQPQSRGIRVTAEIKLPTSHPRFHAAALGVIAPADFVRAFLGFIFTAYFGTHTSTTLSIHEDSATVRYEWSNENENFIYVFGTNGVARYPLLTAKDTVTFHFGGDRPHAYGGILPTELSAEQAVWRGPITEMASIVVHFGSADDRPPDLRAQRPDQQLPKTLHDFMTGLSVTGPESLSAAASRTLFALLPFIGLFWIARRSFVGRTVGWSTFVVGSEIVAAWICWPLISTVFLRPVHALTWGLLPKVIDIAGLSVNRPAAVALLKDLDRNTFALVLVAATALLPWVVRARIATGQEPSTPLPAEPRRARPRWRTTLALVIRFAPAVLAAFAALVVVRAYHDPKPIANTIADSLRAGGPARWEEVVRMIAQAGLWVTAYLILAALAAIPSRTRSAARPWRRGLRWAAAGVGLLFTLAAAALLVVILVHAKDVAEGIDDLVVAEHLSARADDLVPVVEMGSVLALLLIGCGLLARLNGWLSAMAGLSACWLFVHMFVRVLHGNLAWTRDVFPQLRDLFEAVPPTFGEFTGWFMLASALLTYPALVSGLRNLLPGQVNGRYPHLVAIALAGVALLLPHLPVKAVITGAATCLTLSVGFVLVRSVAELTGTRFHAPWLKNRIAAFVALVIIGVTIAWPYSAVEGGLTFSTLISFADELRALALYLPVLGLVIALLHAQASTSVGDMRLVGGFFFAVFMVQASTTWLLVVPLPFLIGLLFARFVVFRPNSEAENTGNAVDEPNPEAAVRKFIASTEIRRSVRVVQKTLSEQFQKMTLSPDEHDKKEAEYLSYLERHEAQEGGPSDRGRAVFARGLPGRSDNALVALQTGAILGAAPFIIALYQYLPQEQIRHPFALASLITFFTSTAATWLVTAFFIGYFLPYLRGNSGLAKGVWVAFALTAPFVLQRLVDTQSIESMKVLAAWVLLMFLFCSTLGLFVLDYRLLRRSGFGVRKLRVVHELPALSAYITTILTALVPTITGLVTGGFKSVFDVVVGWWFPKR